MCCSCDIDEKIFERSYKSVDFNSEITSNLLNQTTREKKDLEVPRTPQGVIGYVNQEGKQLPYRPPTYVAPPMIPPPQQNEGEDSPYHLENPYN